MPIYSIFNSETEEYDEVFMSYSSLQEHLKENPHLELIIHAPSIVSGVSGVTHKLDSGFKDVMSRIADANPHSPLAQQYGDKGVKATKVREAVNRQKGRQQ